MKRVSNRFIFLLTYILLAGVSINVSGQTNAGDPALKEKQHQFDFWLGEWDVYKYGTDKLVGKSHIMSINDSTGILENYHTPNGPYKGKSLNTYNIKTGFWEQYWIDNGGLVLKLGGEFREGKMIMLSYEGLSANKISWQKVDKGVRQTWETSKDGGKNWNVVFDGLYIRVES